MRKLPKLLMVTPILLARPGTTGGGGTSFHFDKEPEVYVSSSTSSINTSEITTLESVSGFISYSNDYYFPHEKSDSIDIVGNYKYSGNNAVYNCYNICYLYSPYYLSGNVPYYSSKSSKFIMNNGYTHKYSYSVNNVKSYLDKDITVVIGIYCDDYSGLIFSKTFKLCSKTHSYINAMDYKHTYFEMNNTYQTDGSCVKERFCFSNFQDYIDSNVYYTLDLSNFSFIYSYILPFSYRSAKLLIYDVHNLFPYLPKDNNGNKYVPLSITSDNHIKYSSPMYLNKITNEMSLEYRPGFITTNKFYLPKGKRKQMENYVFSIELEDCGANLVSISCLITYTSNHDLIGGYGSGMFHIKGGVVS